MITAALALLAAQPAPSSPVQLMRPEDVAASCSIIIREGAPGLERSIARRGYSPEDAALLRRLCQVYVLGGLDVIRELRR